MTVYTPLTERIIIARSIPNSASIFLIVVVDENVAGDEGNDVVRLVSYFISRLEELHVAKLLR